MRVADVKTVMSAPLTEYTADGLSIVCGILRGRAFAFDSTCPHKGGPLEKGGLRGQRIKCPWHGYEFNVFTGKVHSIPYSAKYGKWRETGSLRLYRAKVFHGFLYVEIWEDESRA